jgi:hypothetical protein
MLPRASTVQITSFRAPVQGDGAATTGQVDAASSGTGLNAQLHIVMRIYLISGGLEITFWQLCCLHMLNFCYSLF